MLIALAVLGTDFTYGSVRLEASDRWVADGQAFEHGEGVPRDPVRAAALYCQAARSGNAEAQYRLGWMYFNGRGIDRHDARAASLFALAAAQQHAYALRALPLAGAARDELPGCMASEETPFPAETGSSLAATDWPGFPIPIPIPPAMSDAATDARPESGAAVLAEVEIPLPPLPSWQFQSPERRRIVDLVFKLAPTYEIDPGLALAIIQAESNFDPDAVSSRNAQGLMQLLPETAERFNVRNSFDPAQNVKGGLAYLRWLMAYFRGDVRLVAAAYNAGEGTVDKYGGIPPFPETIKYVEKVSRYFPRRTHRFDSRLLETIRALMAERRRGRS